MKKTILAVWCILCSLSIIRAQEPEIYKNENLPIHDRVMDLLSKLTVEEKIDLLRATSPENKRLGIPKYYHGNEALHGVVRPGKFTVFPQAIGLAAMWNPELHYKIATAISDEARARWNELGQGEKQQAQFSDLLTFWSPTVNMARDPRWGRTPETYGEDPYLSGVLGTQFVKGLQGNDPRYLKVVSTPKHFAGNNEEHNRFECKMEASERVLREYYLPAFEACIVDGNAESIMTAYNAINGVPCTANSWLLKEVLRGDWKFDGYVVSDCGAPSFLVSPHHYVATNEEAAAKAIKAGLDLECGDNIFIEPLKKAYESGMVSDAEIDSAAYHVLRARMRLGLFDDPKKNPYNQIPPSTVGCKEHQELALEAARQCIVLLKNQGNMLPLNPDKIKSIAVVGINAASCEFGDYSGVPINEPVSVLQGIRNRVGNQVEVKYAPWVSSQDGYEIIDKSFFPEGLNAEYFHTDNLTGKSSVRKDSWINFEPANQAPDPFIPKSPLSIRWKGKLRPTISGKYTIGFRTDDGCRLYIDGKLLIDSWGQRSAVTDEITIELKAGKDYDICAEYFDAGGEAVAKLMWKAPTLNKEDRLAMYGDAAKVVRSCDMTIAVLGINKSIEREGQDRNSISLPADQEEFIQAIYELNPNTVVVLIAGSSLAINWMNDHIPAIVNAWYPGEQGGTAIAEVLFGDYNPAGRLPITYYKSMNDLLPFNDYDVTKGRTYQYFQGEVLYPFGYGLSYTQFDYSNLNIRKEGDDKLTFSFAIKNSGKMDGNEVPQLYVRFPRSKQKMPLKQLKGFKRVSLKSGDKSNVSIEVDIEDLRIWDENAGKFVTPSGEYTFMIGASSEDIRLEKKFTL